MRYLLFYKPYNVLTQFTDRYQADPSLQEESAPPPLRSTLKEFIDVPDVYPVGRLDRDSEGLLLLTNDGLLASRLIDPRYGHHRTYWAQVENIPDSEAIAQLDSGVMVKGRLTKPANVRAITEPLLPPRPTPIRFRKSIPTSWLELTLTEGRNRQVRRMTAAVGHPTLRLIRVRLGTLTLQGLDPGQWRDLTPEELLQLRQLVAHPVSGQGRSKRRSSTGGRIKRSVPPKGTGEVAGTSASRGGLHSPSGVEPKGKRSKIRRSRKRRKD